MRILVVYLLNIGDILFTTPALRALRKANPDAQIDMLVNKPFADMVRHNPHLSNVLEFDKHGRHRSAAGFVDLLRSLRARRYDLAIDLHGAAKTTVLTTLCGARRRVGLASKGFEWLYSTSVSQRRDIHRADSYLEVLRELGVPPTGDPRMELLVDDASAASAANKWSSEGLPDSGVIALNTGARAAAKQWPVQRWIELGKALVDAGRPTLLLGGPEDRHIEPTIRSAGACTHALTGRLTLLELAAVLRTCALLVTGDTGPMHIAVSQDTPLVALFGPGNPDRTGPYHARCTIVRADVDCPGCAARSESGHVCMEAIDAARVYEAVAATLAAYPRPEQ